jgi:hypothetical protein
MRDRDQDIVGTDFSSFEGKRLQSLLSGHRRIAFSRKHRMFSSEREKNITLASSFRLANSEKTSCGMSGNDDQSLRGEG